jgi:hypothetical protein
MTAYIDALRTETNLAFTENGAVTNRSSLDPVVDFFALGGAMRDTPEDAADLFELAFQADPLSAVRVMFYLRDVRGGQGEREVFRACLRRLASYDGPAYRKIIAHIPFYGRWDDVFHSGVSAAVVQLVSDQLNDDLLALCCGGPVSLMAKWLPSENTSSAATRKRAYLLRRALNMTPRRYRKTLSVLRERIHLLEQDMSANRWQEIDFAKLPSQAHRKHVNAFYRHTPAEYITYLDSVGQGAASINVATLYPYEVFDMVRKGQGAAADVMWSNLPDYTAGKNALVMADVSGSMEGRPMSVSVSLALYFAERNQGAFNGYFLTFSAQPRLVKVRGDTLSSRLSFIHRSEWGGNTNLLEAFRAMLDAALRSGEAPPSVLYVVSDMEFDEATGVGRQGTVFHAAQTEFAECGYDLPHVVFWNVNARNMQAPATILDGNVSLVSGCSPTVFGMAVEGKSPAELMRSVIDSDRYASIVL